MDRLLDSPRYGEHMARFWLDAARYGDTHGLHLDNYREIWPYRDWVIRAFNDNMPFDRFIVEQLAGDLLPNPTLDQIVATGFNRCHVSTSEGGSIEEEVYVRNIVDQVDTNGTVFLGLTTGCARCHDHKYDPIRAKDYYQLFAFFNNIDGPAMDGNSAKWAPSSPCRPPRSARPSERSTARSRRSEKSIAAEIARATAAGEAKARVETPEDAGRLRRPGRFRLGRRCPAAGRGAAGRPALEVRRQARSPGLQRAAGAGRQGQGAQAVRLRERRAEAGRRRGGRAFRPRVPRPEGHAPGGHAPVAHGGGLVASRRTGAQNAIGWGKDGTPERLAMGELPAAGRWVRLEVPVDRLKLAPGTAIDGWAFTQHGGTVHWDAAGITTRTPQDGQLFESFGAWVKAQRDAGAAGGLPAELKAAVGSSRSKWTDRPGHGAGRVLHRACRRRDRAGDPAVAGQAGRRRDEAEGDRGQAPTTLVFRERAGEPKPAFLLKRGEYDQRGEKVGRGVPAFLPPLAAGRAGQPARAGEVAGRAQPPADRPGGRQSPLAPGLRHRAGQDGRGLRLAGRAAQPSRAAGLAGGPVPRGRLGRQADDEAAGDVGHLPAVVAGRAREARQGPG